MLEVAQSTLNAIELQVVLLAQEYSYWLPVLAAAFALDSFLLRAGHISYKRRFFSARSSSQSFCAAILLSWTPLLLFPHPLQNQWQRNVEW